MTRRSARGYALPLVLVLAAVMAAGFALYLNRIQGVADATGSMLKRRQAFYVADGLARAATEIASAKMIELPAPTDDVEADPTLLAAFLEAQRLEVQDVIDDEIGDLAPAGYTLRAANITGLGERSLERLETGPFRGMLALQQPMELEVEVAHDDELRGATASMRSSVVRGTISMFQFFAFIDGYAYLYTGTGARFAGRIHANGNVCMGSGSGLYAENITAVGGFYVARSSGCRNEVDYHESERAAFIASRPLSGGLAELYTDPPGLWVQAGEAGTSANQFDRDGPGAGPDLPAAVWRTTSESRWGGQLMDAANDVQTLRVPIIGQPLVHQGRNATHAAESNQENSRFLVDPVLAADPPGVRNQKFAFKADLRIVNGVWYVRNLADPASIGTPIWSDHPGRYSGTADDAWVGAPSATLGQEDLFAASPRPRRYSYYRTSTAGDLEPIDMTARPVLSYGTLVRSVVAGQPQWTPGYYDPRRCNLTTDVNGVEAGSGGGEIGCATDVDGGRLGWSLRPATTPWQLLQGTRAGFRNTWGEVSVRRNDRSQRDNLLLAPNADYAAILPGADDNTGGRSPLFNTLPINFDVAAFTAAMQDTAAGELGSYFGVARPFNGIIYIGSSWPDQLQGMTNNVATATLPRLWPVQGSQADNAGLAPQPARTGAANAARKLALQNNHVPGAPPYSADEALNRHNEPFQQALPYALCSDDVDVGGAPIALTAAGASVSPPGDGNTADGERFGAFYRSACARYRDTAPAAQQLHARPNAVRIHNGRTIDDAVFPQGLTIATNLPAYVLGSFNETSVPSDLPGTTSDDEDWRPALVAADTVTILSNAWHDTRAPWNLRAVRYGPDAGTGSMRLRVATDTTYNMQVLAGWLVSSNGNRDEVAYFTRLMENWDDAAARNVRGSVVIGFNAQYGFRFDWSGQSNLDSNGSNNKVYAYDYNLDVPSNQPPGAPRFQVTATRTYRRN